MEAGIALKPTRVRSANTLDLAIRHLGEVKQHQSELLAERDRRLAEINAEYGPTIESLDGAIDAQMKQIGTYVEANREALFGKKKSTDLEAGRVALVSGRPTVQVDDQDVAIAALKKLRGKASTCVITKTSLDKRALLNLRPEVEGVTYVEGTERLQVKPVITGTLISAEL